MIDWWAENGPPVHVAVAGYLGLLKPKKKKAKTASPTNKSESTGNLNELVEMFKGSGGVF